MSPAEAATHASRGGPDAGAPAPPESIRTRLAAWNFASLLFFTLVTIFTGLAITPAVVRLLGDDRYGFARMILDLVGYLALLELGLGGALGPLLARAAGRGDERALRGTMAAGVRLYLVVAGAIVAVGLALAPWVHRLVSAPPGYAGDVRAAWLVATAGFLLLGLSPFRALAEARQRGYKVNLVMAAQALFVAFASLAFAARGGGVTGQILALTLANALVAGLLAGDGLRQRPGLLRAAAATRPDPEVWRSLRSLSPPTLLMNACGRAGLLTDYLIVGNILADGPAMVTSLFLTQRLAVLAQAQLQGIGNAAWAGLAEIHARGDDELFRRRLVELTRLIAILGVAGLAPIVAYNSRFFALWMPEKLGDYGGPLVVRVAAANALAMGLTSLWGWCFSGTGQVRRIVATTAAATAVNVAVSVAATWALQRASGPRAATIGPLLGTTAGFVLVSLWAMPLQLKRAFGVRPADLAAAVAWPMAWGLPYAAALRRLALARPPAGWAELVAAGGLAAAGYLALAWAVLFGPQDRLLWRRRLGEIWPRARGR